MTDRELMQQALEALEEMGGGYSQNLIAALRERLAQPEQMSACPHGVPHRWLCEICDQPEQEPVVWALPKMHPVMELRFRRRFRVR